MNGIPAEGRKACGGAGLATARCPGSLASGGTADQTAPVCLGTHGAWPQTQIPAEGPPGGLWEEDTPFQGVGGGHSGESLGLGSPWLLVQVLPLPAPQARQPLAWLSPYIWPRFPHLRAGGGRGQDSVVDGICGTRARPGPGSLAGGPVPRETVSESAAVAAAERRGPATPTGPGMRKERGECPGPGAQTILISWPRFNPSPGLPGPPSTSSKGLA